jgi:hypothetical protein
MSRSDTYCTFSQRVQQLKDYCRKHGNFNIGQHQDDDPSLARFITLTLYRYRAGELSDSEVAEVREIGFNLDRPARRSVEDVMRRLAVLKKYREKTGHGCPGKGNSNPEYAALAQWVYRMRRSYHGGLLSQEVVALIEAADIGLKRDPVKVERSTHQQESSYERNFEVLSTVLEEIEAATGERDLRHRDIRGEDERAAYRLIERMVLKARENLLSEAHRTRLLLLSFAVNGTPIEEFLRPRKSTRAAPDAPHPRA